VLITDLFEGGDAKSMLARVAGLQQSGVNVIVLLALSDDGHPAFTRNTRSRLRPSICAVFRLHARSVPRPHPSGVNTPLLADFENLSILTACLKFVPAGWSQLRKLRNRTVLEHVANPPQSRSRLLSALRVSLWRAMFFRPSAFTPSVSTLL
jgi:hypothetical protein